LPAAGRAGAGLEGRGGELAVVGREAHGALPEGAPGWAEPVGGQGLLRGDVLGADVGHQAVGRADPLGLLDGQGHHPAAVPLAQGLLGTDEVVEGHGGLGLAAPDFLRGHAGLVELDEADGQAVEAG